MLTTLKNLWSVIEKNRFSVILPFFGLIFWAYVGISCTPVTQSPLNPNIKIDAKQLQQEYDLVVIERQKQDKAYEFAADDIKTQEENWSKVQDSLIQIASGSVTSWSGLVQILVSSGLVGFFADNLRKNGVIAGLKRNKS